MARLANGYPERAITVVVPFDPGGGTDVMMRALAAGVEQEKLLPVPLVIENRSGGSGVVGRQYVLGRPADGYTLVNTSEDLPAAQLLGQVKWDYRNDFSHITRLVSDYNMICVKADSPYKSVQDLIAAAKAGRVNWGGTSIGGADHVQMIQFGKAAGVPTSNLNFVSFRSGGEVINNLLGGQIAVAWANPSEIIGQLEGRTARALGVSSPQRLGESLANVPTIQEQGTNLVVQQWRGVAGPKGLPAEIVQFHEQFFQRAMQTRAWNDYVKKGQLINAYLDSKGTQALLEEDYKTLDAIFTELGLKK